MPSTLGLDALLDFDVKLTFDGKNLSKKEIETLLLATEGLVLIKGKWIEVDRDKLGAVLDHWLDAPRSPELKKLPKKEVDAHDAVITTYGTTMRTEWMTSYAWRNVILDEARVASALKGALSKPECRNEKSNVPFPDPHPLEVRMRQSGHYSEAAALVTCTPLYQ